MLFGFTKQKQCKLNHTITHVVMPDDSVLEVTYYCSDAKLEKKKKRKLTRLIIQLHDCICSVKIEKSICAEKDKIENIIHNKVIMRQGAYMLSGLLLFKR